MAEPSNILSRAQALIAELRNRRDPEVNWRAFRALIEDNRAVILETFDSRWLISVCDTYADYAEPVCSRNALLISQLIGLVRVSDSLFEDRDIREERAQQIKSGWPPTYDGLNALHLDRQDTLLNLAKRLTRALQTDPLMHAIYLELLRRMKANDNLITRFARRSARPEWVLPEEPLEIVDNYGVV